MADKRRVLVVDNDMDMRDMLAFRLDIAGYRVFTAESVAAALELLEREVVHMAVLDVRLDDDSRPGDQSGFDLSQQLPDYIPYIAFTAYEDMGNLRRANRLGSRIQSKAVDNAIPQLLELMEDTFTKAEINVDLVIHLRDRQSFDELARQIQVAGRPDAPPPSGDDLVRILQTLFYSAAEVEVAPLLPPDKAPTFSQSGSLLVRARAHHGNRGRAEPVVVKFSSAEEIRREAENFPLIEPFLHGNRRANLRSEAYSRRLGGLVYDLIDDEDLSSIRNFEEVYKRCEAAKIVALLERFFGQMLAPLFLNAQARELDLTEIYTQGLRLTPEKLEAALLRLHPQDAPEPQLRLPGLREPQLNPLVWLRQGEGFRRFSARVPVCLCHGDLHGRNILVDSEDRFWLIDFARVGESHALRDFAELETDIKFNLLREIDLGELLPFERRLLAPARFGEPLPAAAPARPQLRKAYEVLGALRRLAAEQLALDGDVREYYQALLFHTLNVLRLNHIGDDQKQYALLAASLICQRLSAWPDWELPPEPPAPPAALSDEAPPERQRALAGRALIVAGFMAAGAAIALALLATLSYLSPSWQQQVTSLVYLALLIVAGFGLVGLVSGATVVAALREFVGRLLGGSPPPPPPATPGAP